MSPVAGTVPRAAEAREGVVSSFGIAGLPLKESSAGCTLSYIYGEGSADTRVVSPTSGRDAIGMYFHPIFFFEYACLAVLSDEERASGGGSTSRSSRAAPSQVGAPAAAATADLGPL